MERQEEGQETDAAAPSGPAYAYKPSLMGAPWQFRLAPDRLVWTVGQRSGSVGYAAIRRLRLSFRPVTMQSYRFTAEIWADGAPKLTIASASWRSMMEQERFDQPYRDFIAALHERIAAAGGKPALEAGANPFLYWPALTLFTTVALAVIALLARAFHQDSWPAMLFLAAFFALLLWQIGGFFRRNRPRRYTGAAIPEDVLPRPAAQVRSTSTEQGA